LALVPKTQRTSTLDFSALRFWKTHWVKLRRYVIFSDFVKNCHKNAWNFLNLLEELLGKICRTDFSHTFYRASLIVFLQSCTDRIPKKNSSVWLNGGWNLGDETRRFVKVSKVHTVLLRYHYHRLCAWNVTAAMTNIQRQKPRFRSKTPLLK